MWYFQALECIARKQCGTQGDEAADFVIALFSNLQTIFFDDESLDPTLLFGVIKDLLRLGREYENTDLPVSDFARLCVGLMILHCKASNESAIWTEDFIPLLFDTEIEHALDMDSEVSRIQDKIKAGVIRLDSVLTSKEVECNQEIKEKNDRLLSIKSLRVWLSRQEVSTFRRLQYHVTAPVESMIQIIDFLYYHVKDPFAFIASLSNYLDPYIGMPASESFLILLQHIDELKINIELLSNTLDLLDNYASTRLMCGVSLFSRYRPIFKSEIITLAKQIRTQQIIDMNAVKVALEPLLAKDEKGSIAELYQNIFGEVATEQLVNAY